MEQRWLEVECCDETGVRSVVWHLDLCGGDGGDGGVYAQRM